MKTTGLAIVVVLTAVAWPALAWDTHINSKDDWRSIYETEQARFCRTDSYHATDGKPDVKATHGGGNEHAEIADDTLWLIDEGLRNKLGIDGEYGLSGADPWMFLDLNATFRRHFDFENAEVMRDDPTTVIEERALGDLVRYAGIPDFNYTIYDWINKSAVCPSIPPNLTSFTKTKLRYDLCASYSMWKGAGLNSSHFGSLASKMWIRHHEIAMKLADEAKTMRETFGLDGMAFHEDFVKEAELMALMYEMAGQHFLQDRWSTGHMFARWGPGGFEDIPRDVLTNDINLQAMLAAAMFTGIVHGSEAIFGFPDPAASPFIDEKLGRDDQIVRSGYSYWENNRAFQSTVNHSGVGDYRFGDLVDEFFDGQPVCSRGDTTAFVDPPAQLNALNQRKTLRYCTSMAVRRVIAAFGTTAAAGSYGALDISLPTPTLYDSSLMLPGPGATTPAAEGMDLTQPGTDEYKVCHDVWLDNATYYRAYSTIFGTSGLIVGKDLWVTAKNLIKADPGAEGPSKPAVRVLAQHTQMRWKALRHMRTDEAEAKAAGRAVIYGTDTARNGFTLAFGPLSGLGWVTYRPNSNYGVPEYMEPVDLETLPYDQNVENDNGRTKWAIHGFFNRAKAKQWCEGISSDPQQQPLAKHLDYIRKNTKHVRDEPRQKELATCAYLATRLYKQTDPDYPDTGSRFERIGDHMPFGDVPYGPAFEPACHYLGPALPAQYENEKSLYYIHPGFVEGPGDEAMWDIGAPDGEKRGLAPATLKNWCNRIPVIDFALDDPDHPDKVAELGRDRSNGLRWAILEGANFGIKTPTVLGSMQAAPSGTPAGNPAWVELDIFDPDTGAFFGGWSGNSVSISPQIPGSGAGFPSTVSAAPGLLPHLIKYALPEVYDLRLVQPDDPDLIQDFQSEGKETVGTYELLVYPTYEESVGDNFGGGIEKKAFFATWPEWVRPTSEILAMGLYIVTPDPASPGQDIYTEIISPPITQTVMDGWFEFDFVTGDPVFMPDLDRVGILLEAPGGFSAQFTGNTIAWVFAFH